MKSVENSMPSMQSVALVGDWQEMTSRTVQPATRKYSNIRPATRKYYNIQPATRYLPLENTTMSYQKILQQQSPRKV